MQVYTTVGAGAAGATAGVVGAAGVAGATAVDGFFVFAGAGALLEVAGAAGAVGAIVAAGVTVGALGVVVPRSGVTCWTGTAFASVTFATNSA